MLTRPVLLYDGDCGFCREWVERLRRWDRHHAIDTVPFQERDRIAGLPVVDRAALDRAMHLVAPDGSITTGARTLPILARYLPGGLAVRCLTAIPGVPWAADRVYAWVAGRRHRLGCGSDSCRIG